MKNKFQTQSHFYVACLSDKYGLSTHIYQKDKQHKNGSEMNFDALDIVELWSAFIQMKLT